jgi:hypothetical protein
LLSQRGGGGEAEALNERSGALARQKKGRGFFIYDLDSKKVEAYDDGGLIISN